MIIVTTGRNTKLYVKVTFDRPDSGKDFGWWAKVEH
jgi:hypothetical protein